MGKRGNRRKTGITKLYVEGDIEEASIRSLLQNRLGRRGIQVRNTRGVDNFFRKIGKYVRNSLDDGARKVIGLIDLHNAIQGRLHLEKEQLIEEVKNKTLRNIDKKYHDRFILCLAVREYEAWALADDAGLSKFIGHKVGPWSNPEDIDGINPPKKVVNKLRLKHCKISYSRVKDGKRLFENIDADVVANKCTHFSEFVANL